MPLRPRTFEKSRSVYFFTSAMLVPSRPRWRGVSARMSGSDYRRPGGGASSKRDSSGPLATPLLRTEHLTRAVGDRLLVDDGVGCDGIHALRSSGLAPDGA